ncbi:MAG TPA: hypothetical protein VFA73_16405 [Actinomycetota bacterium]|nr:hypothetical protein [Actinomycetota bacterium]
MRTRTRVVLAWALWLVTFGCCAAGLLVTLAIYRPLTLGVLAEGALYAFFFVLGFATVGLVLALRRPGNPIGWLYGAAGLAWAYTIPLAPWVDQLLREHRPLPLLAQLHVALSEFGWAPAIGLGVTLPALLLPNGHLRSRRWRLVVVTSVTGFVLATVGGALSPGPIEEAGIDNPLGLAGPAGDVASVLTIVGVLLHWWSLPPAAVCVILRFRSSRGVERQQMRWVAAGAAGAVAGLLLALPSGLGIAPNFVSHIIFPALLCPPVAIGVAVLRYRLYDLDRVISRTLTYGLLTVLLGLGYAGVVLGLGRLLPDSSSLVVAAATLAVAGLFQPIRRRVQALVDRRFNRHRYDAARTVDGFAARLRDQVDLDALHGELLAVVDQTMQPTRASLWLRHAP